MSTLRPCNAACAVVRAFVKGNGGTGEISDDRSRRAFTDDLTLGALEMCAEKFEFPKEHNFFISLKVFGVIQVLRKHQGERRELQNLTFSYGRGRRSNLIII